MSARCPRPAPTVGAVAELIVRELRLRPFPAARPMVPAVIAGDESPRQLPDTALPSAQVERLASRHSRRRFDDDREL